MISGFVITAALAQPTVDDRAYVGADSVTSPPTAAVDPPAQTETPPAGDAAQNDAPVADPAQTDASSGVDVDTAAPETPENRGSVAASKSWLVGGFVDLGYLLNSNFPDNHVYRGTVTTPRTGEFTLQLASAYLMHEPIEPEPWRFELGLQFGAATDALYAGEPIPGGVDGRYAGAEVWKHVALANAGGKIEQSGTEIGAGLFASPIGIGGFWSRFNWNVSPSWESNAAPFYLMGGRVVQDLPAGFTAQVWIVNGWQTVGDTNKAPAYLAGLSWERGDFGAAQFVYFGPDDNDLSPRAWRVHSDTQATWDGPRGGVGVVWDYGQERVTGLPGEPVHQWSGGGLFGHVLAYDGHRADLDFAARPDAWYDSDGRIYGVAQWLVSGTGTVNVTLFDALLARVEYRYDHSTAPAGFFYDGSATSDGGPGLAKDQHTVFFNVVGYFEHVFAIRRKQPQPTSNG